METLWLSLLGAMGVGKRDTPGMYWVLAGDTAKHPPVPGTAPHNHHLAPNVSGAKVGKPWSKLRLKDGCKLVVLGRESG